MSMNWRSCFLSWLLTLGVLLGGMQAAVVDANEIASPPTIDYNALPRLPDTWLEANPYRGKAELAAEAFNIGRSAFNQSCARCHGADAATNAAPAPDLRNLDRVCRGILDPATQKHCMADNDAFFAKSVREGKRIVGVVHMPPWQGILPQEVAWAIQLFIERQAVQTPIRPR